MKRAKIYIPTKTSMQSGRGKQKKWLLEFYTNESRQNHLMDWQTSTDTLSEVKLAFPSKEQVFLQKKNGYCGHGEALLLLFSLCSHKLT